MKGDGLIRELTLFGLTTTFSSAAAFFFLPFLDGLSDTTVLVCELVFCMFLFSFLIVLFMMYVIDFRTNAIG